MTAGEVEMATKRSASKDTLGERYFEFLAGMGLTKHLASMKATEELIALCAIGDGKYILDVGCGVGAGLQNIVANAYKVDIPAESRGRFG